MPRLLRLEAHHGRLVRGRAVAENGGRQREGSPSGRLDLDDVGAEVGQDAAGQLAQLVGQVEHAVGTQQLRPRAPRG